MNIFNHRMHASNAQGPQGFSETRFPQKNSNYTHINASKAPRIAPCQEYGSPLNPRITTDFEKKGWNHKANMHPQSNFSGSGSMSFQTQQSFYDSASNNERESSIEFSEKDSQSFYFEDPYDSRSEATDRSDQNSYGSQKSNTTNHRSWKKNFARNSAKQVHKNSDWHQIAVNYFEVGTFYAQERQSDSTYPDRFYSYRKTQERGEIKLCYPSRQGKEAKKIQLQFQNKRIGFAFDFCEAIYSKLESDRSCTVYFHLKCIPLFEIIPKNTDKFSRTLNFIMPQDCESLRKECLFRSTVIKVSFADNQFSKVKRFLSRKKIADLWRKLRKFEVIKRGHLEFPYLTYNKLINSRLSFQIRFALLACLTHKKVNLYEINASFMRLLEQLDSETVLKTLEDIYKIERKFDSLSYYKPFKTLFFELYDENAATKAQWISTEVPQNFCKVKAVTITPTVINYSFGEYALSNPVLQRYKNDQDSFIRVTFSDDMGKGIQKLPWIIEKRFKKLAGNLHVLDRTYRFLAYSQSQLRNNTAWMFADNGFFNGEDILNELGDFSPIKTPAKNGARKGQLFSASLKTIELDESTNIKNEEDIKTKEGKHTFSEGIGRISSDLTDFIRKKCNIQGILCAIQVRLGGVKGLLVEDPDLKANTIVLRPSMIKFSESSFFRTLSVLDYNRYHAAYLNKQIIVLLLTNGVQKSIFPQLQEENFKGITKGYVSNLLHYVTDDTQLPVKNVIRDCISKNINIGTDPFLTGVISSIQTQAFRSTLDSKLLVKEGAILTGVLDEYNILKPGEIFVCISPSNGKDNDLQIISGTMIVTKNPCLHPGDIRLLKGVCTTEIKKKLGHLVNCIVFPAQGERPHTNEIAGSDLDGDKYFVSWDQRLVPPKEVDPMRYDAQKLKEQNIISTKDIINFFFEYAVNDKLGTIDHAHLACMDYHVGKGEGPCQNCKALTGFHSIAVDYAKNGNKPERDLEDFIPKKFPEHMGKEGSKSENSGSVLEYLCANLKEMNRTSALFRLYKNGLKISSEDIKIDHRLVVKGFERYLSIALSALQMYYQETTFFMSKYGIRNEYEVYSCSFTKFKKNSKYHHKNAVDLAQLQEKVAIHIETIQARVKKLIEPFLEDKYARNIEQIASAFYVAAYYNENCKNGYIHEIMRKIGPGGELLVKLKKDNGQMIGLPWYNFSEILVNRLQMPH